MSLTKRWMEAQGLFDDDVFRQISDEEYEYIKWIESQPSSSLEDRSDVPESKDPS